MDQTKNSIRNVWILGEQRFLCQFEKSEFLKSTADLNTVSKRQQMQWKVKAYTATPFKSHLGRFSKKKKKKRKKKKCYPSCILLVFVQNLKFR